MVNTRRLFQFLHWSLIVGMSGLVSLIVLGIVAPSTQGLSPLEVVCVLAMVSASLPFYICLGILAKRLGRSWITWIGLTFMTKPIGPFIAYFKMRNLVNNSSGKILI